MTPWRPPTCDELTLRTGRLLLRPIGDGDAEALFVHTRDPDLPRQMTWAPHETIDRTREFIATCTAEREADRGYTWVIEERGEVAGVVGLDAVSRGHSGARFDRAELGYWLGRSYRGRGLVTEAARAVLDLGFSRLALHKVTVHAFTANAASLRVVERLGFTRVGRKREDVEKDGVWHDQLAFEMLADDRSAAS